MAPQLPPSPAPPSPESQPDLHLRRVLVYVSGSIAAYRACDVVTSLRKRGALVRVAMTRAAAGFISPVTLQALSGNPVATSLSRQAAAGPGHGMEHIGLSAWAEVQVAVAASSDLIARLTLGLADDAVTTTALACTAPLVITPAMETRMWTNPATQAHVATLRQRGVTMVGPVSGRLASGSVGAGRMAEPEEIVAAVVKELIPGGGGGWLEGSTVVVSAGGTREAIDPVRFIGNRSSGKMGNALAEEALRLGAQVILVTTVAGPDQRPGLRVVHAETAEDLLTALRAALQNANVLIMAAAVADYRPTTAAASKLKKKSARLLLELTPTPDILGTLRDEGALEKVTVVGFAAETDDLVARAREKLITKRLDLVVANDVGTDGIGIGADDNAVVIIDPRGIVESIDRAPKPQIAHAVFAALKKVMPATAILRP